MNQATQQQTFNSSKYFVTRNGLYVWPEFAERTLPAYQQPIPKRGIKGIDHIDLPRNMYDREIVAEYLGEKGEEARKGALTPDQLAELIVVQWCGKSGVLLNNGYANILYMIGKDGVLFAVLVRWLSADRQWDVGAYALDVGLWSAGSRVFRNKH